MLLDEKPGFALEKIKKNKKIPGLLCIHNKQQTSSQWDIWAGVYFGQNCYLDAAKY